MRTLLAAAVLVGAAIAGVAVALNPHPAHAQSLDRYGGAAAAAPPPSGQAASAASPYATPAYALASVQPSPYAPAPSYRQGRGPHPRRAAYPAAPGYAPPTAVAAGLRTLSWPGKDGAAPVASAPARPPVRQAQAYAPPTAYSPPAARSAPARVAGLPTSGGVQPRPSVLRVVRAPDPNQPPGPVLAQAYAPATSAGAAAAPTVRAPASAPANLYSDAPAAARPAFAPPPASIPTAAASAPEAPAGSAQAQETGQALTPAQRAARMGPPSPASTARLYSVHRDYGLTPDPAPIPPQFFANTADLTQPETPEVATRPTSATPAGAVAARAAQNAARLAAGAAQ